MGFNADADFQVNEKLRFVQLTPPGSACSIAIGTGLVDSAPGSVKGLQLAVTDIEAARAELRGGASTSEVQDFPWGRFIFFNDPDGNGWAVQEVPERRLTEAMPGTRSRGSVRRPTLRWFRVPRFDNLHRYQRKEVVRTCLTVYAGPWRCPAARSEADPA